MTVYPEIGEDVIQAWVGTKAFQRGYRYFEDESIMNPRRRGESLIAECQGSQPAPYRVEINLGPAGIRWGNCTCPAGDGGHCKHAAALLLTWLHEPESFSEVPELDSILENRTTGELIALIQQMVARHPDLEQLLELHALGNAAQGQPIQAEMIVQQVSRAFSAAGGEMGSNTEIADNLQAVLDLGGDLLERKDVSNAAIVYQTLMESMLNYEECLYQDDRGELSQVLAESEQGIYECLESSDDPQLRRPLLRTLFDFILWDVHAGGLGFADETPEILIEKSTPEEKEMITGWIEAELSDGDARNGVYWQRALGGLWLELLGDPVDDELYLQICARTGRTRDMANRLLLLNRIDEALATARREPGNAIIDMANLFEKHGHHELGLQLVREQPNAETDILMLEWLKQYAVRHHRPDEALRLAELLFWRVQSLENYDALLETAEMVDARESIRARVLERLESAGNFSLLVEIYLLEEEIDLALSALELVKPEIWWGRLSVLRRRVAEAVESQRPREAIRQYLLLAEDLIEQRSRGSYAEAARFLLQVRKLYQGLGELEVFDQLIAGIRQEYRRLPALQDELRRAAL